jgi:hypothetical protein
VAVEVVAALVATETMTVAVGAMATALAAMEKIGLK